MATVSIVKSFSVGNGDMFYIDHNSDSFTIIDCCMEGQSETVILSELRPRAAQKGKTRFISTHPDNDHIRGLVELDDALGIVNFYCVKNQATKKLTTNDFTRYVVLRDGSRFQCTHLPPPGSLMATRPRISFGNSF